MLWVGAWYACSLVTLFSNKYIVSELNASAWLLGLAQMLVTTIAGGAKVYLLATPPAGRASQRPIVRDLALLGALRCATALFGLIALAHVAVSFVEAIKSSAPLFTALFAFLILHEATSLRVGATLLPICAGLALASATELSADAAGLTAALLCNALSVLSNVHSKRVIATTTPVHLQFYTSAAASLIQVPVMVVYSAWDSGRTSSDWTTAFGASEIGADDTLVDAAPSRTVIVALLVNGLFFHLQSVAACVS